MNPRVANLLKYGGALEKKLSRALADRLRMSESKMKDRYAQIATNEELFQAFIPERDVDALRRVNREQNGVPEYRTIELPYSYASLMTAHTYYTSVFCARSPVLQLAGRHGESEQKRTMVETLLQYQMQVGQMLLPLYVWLLDPGKAGYGVIMHHWDDEKVQVREIVDESVTFLGMPIPDMKGGYKTKKVDRVTEMPGYQGNRTVNVRPQDWFPDPRVALVHFQKGEFCARYVEVPWNEIYQGARPDAQGNQRYFNYDALKQLRAQKDKDQTVSQVTRDEGGRSTTLPGTGVVEDVAYDIPVGFIKGHEVFLKLIPREWGLGSEDREEIWVFNRASNGAIFGAMPLGELSGKFPFDVLVDEIDGYSIFPRSMLERIKPLNDVLSWLINTHFYNVRQTLNNQFVVDPSMIVMKDLENPEPGKIIRLKPQAYGKDVRLAVNQLQSVDITRTHIQDVGLIQSFMERVTGANDSMMGMMEAGGRKTATEVRTATSFGVNRLKTQCEWYSVTGFGPYAQKIVQRTQQRYNVERAYRIVGDQALFSPTGLIIGPGDIAGFYDFETVDGTLPVDRFAQANLWQMLMQQMAAQPQILMQYDIAKIFAWVANLAGIKNMAQFRLSPDEAILRQAQAGNVVPISEARKQVPNVGPTA